MPHVRILSRLTVFFLFFFGLIWMWGLCDHLTWGRWSCFLACRLSMALPVCIGGRLHGSSVVSALASNLKVPGSIPGVGKGISMSDHTFLRVICGDDIKTVCGPSNQVVNWASTPLSPPLCKESHPHPPCRLRNLRQFKMVTCGLYPDSVLQTAYSPFDIFWKVFFFFFILPGALHRRNKFANFSMT